MEAPLNTVRRSVAWSSPICWLGKILAYFPNNANGDATPACVAKGPDGALYIGTLALVNSIVFSPSAKIFRVDPSQTDPPI